MQEARRPRWPWLLGGFALLLVAGALWVNAQLEPRRLARTVLDKAGASLQLRLGFDGTPEYAFKPEPRLVLPGFSAATLDGEVFLSAKRAEISLPWSTLTGGEPVITRVQLDAPVLDLQGLQRWQASRPPTPFRLPTLSRGISVANGIVRAGSWSLQGFALELPHLKSGDAAKLDARGEYLSGATKLPFELQAALATPGPASPLDLKLKLLPSVPAAEPGKPAQPTPVAIALAGNYRWSDPEFTLDAQRIGVVGSGPFPSLDGKAHVQLSDHMSLGLEAVLSRWPQTWPKLPAALATKSEKLPLQLRYEGRRDFSDALSLSAARDDTSLEAKVKVPQLQRWLAAGPASPLPPLEATLKARSLDFEGVQLQGVEVQLSEGDGAESAP